MRAAPSVELTVAPDPLWRVLVALLLGAVLAALLAWALLATAVPVRWRGAALLLGLLLSAWLGWCEVVAHPMRLRWDGQAWHWREAASLRGSECRGRLSVVADFGGWLLLQLRPEAGPRPRSRWLALSRRALPTQWHALRCAVYSAVPAAPSGGAPSHPGLHER